MLLQITGGQSSHKYKKNENNVSTGSRTPMAGGDAYHYTIGVAVERHFEKSLNKLETT